ncbi:hypothetical protein EJ06DRAFT_43438 [Trichodelitschia bisporula]|uniref:Zn(2)-C6 fungal-type domain-containing protein n=1 Tax=Trichodelitschia bisporula TaxID=703511 RepID=A0A6G1HVD7_9PEZI|nr:hypothetical protein EJ06DRAFT_43438 [Trichodelitschia bisporula]
MIWRVCGRPHSTRMGSLRFRFVLMASFSGSALTSRVNLTGPLLLRCVQRAPGDHLSHELFGSARGRHRRRCIVPGNFCHPVMSAAGRARKSRVPFCPIMDRHDCPVCEMKRCLAPGGIHPLLWSSGGGWLAAPTSNVPAVGTGRSDALGSCRHRHRHICSSSVRLRSIATYGIKGEQGNEALLLRGLDLQRRYARLERQ